MTGDESRPAAVGIWKFVPQWIPRRTPDWAPNPLAGVALFVLEALIVFALALVGFGVAALALWIF